MTEREARTEGTSRPVRRGRGRRPTEEVRRDVLQAAGELLLAEGMAGFSIDAVASRSGASKMTIYKLWSSKGALALDGYFATVETELAFPDTGDIEADLRAQLHRFVRLITATGAGHVIGQLIGAAQVDTALQSAYLARYSSPRRALAVEAMNRARERGQLQEGLDTESVVDQLWGACYHRLLVPDRPLTHAFADTLIDNLFRGIGTSPR